MKATVLAVAVLMSAASASAAMVRLTPISPRINPLAGLPALLPSPLTGPLAGHGVTLPAPSLAPSVVASLPAAPAPAPALAVFAPSAAREALPRLDMDAGRENARNPFAAVLPDSMARLTAPNEGVKPGTIAPQDDELRGLFDGARDPHAGAWNPILPRERAPQPRRHGLPEDELERELGFGPNL